jgi:hypothetical protein
MDNFTDLVKYITDEDILSQHHGIIGIRKILCLPEDRRIQKVIDAGLIPIMIEKIKQKDYPQLQL